MLFNYTGDILTPTLSQPTRITAAGIRAAT